jgi:hypothetical protein
VTFTEWAIERVDENEPAVGPAAGRRIQELVDALRAVRSGGGQIFGLGASSLEPEGRPRVEAAIVDRLVLWKELYVGEGDLGSLLDLDRVGRALDIPELAMIGRPKLLCAPDGALGSRDGLGAEWRARLARLDAVVRGEHTVDFAALEVVGFENGDEPDDPPIVVCGAPEDEVLYEKALRFESAQKRAYPRELAAFVSTLNGLAIDGDPFLRPISQWRFNDYGLEIGCGGYLQGSLTIERREDVVDDLNSPVVDRDDDGEARAEYANVGALIDAIVGKC